MKKRLLRYAKRCFIAVLLLWGAFLLCDLIFPLPEAKPYSRLVFARDSSLLHATLSPDDKWRMHTTLDEVPDELVESLIAKEDRWFWQHPGVNPIAVGRALLSNLGAGNRISGASTITMQVARMLEPKPRTFWGKLKEMFRAFQLEWHYSKREILEMYLSYLPYGGNVEGVEAASYLYFERPPQRLSLSQSIILTVIPNRPNSLRPDRHPEALKAARDKWALRFAAEGIFDQNALSDALREPISTQRNSIPAQAPQFALRMLSESKAERIYTTLDPRVQAQAETLLRNHVGRVRQQGIHNGAVLVVDRLSQEVLAYCGSADFADKLALGEVDAVQALRSPGSTLKPFLYASAFDRGLLCPKMKVMDLPFEAAGYAPMNYDRTCTGAVTTEYALRHSLNLPAVRILHEIGLQPFVQGLSRAGFAGISKHQEDLGLSLVLGGCGVRLEELVRAYLALANGGNLKALRYQPAADGDPSGLQLMSPEAAYLVTEVLSGLERPDLPQGLLERSQMPRVAWKTGTSFGRRDAWAIGYSPRHVIGVWMGNMDGSPSPTLAGASTATPLLVALFNALEAGSAKQWFAQPAGLERRNVCTETGLLPGPDCPHTCTDLRIRGRSPMRRCEHLRSMYTNAGGTLRYCPACLPQSGYKTAHYHDLDPELLGWMQRTGRVLALPPPHAPDCPAMHSGPGPKIVSPRVDGSYWVEAGQSIVLQASVSPTVSQLYWFANDAFVGATPADGKLAIAPQGGQLRIACMDDQGQMSEVAVEVNLF